MMQTHELSREINLRGQAALNLVNEVAQTISATEQRNENRIVQVLERIRIVEDRKRILAARVTRAEKQAHEAEKWLTRLQSEMKEKLGCWAPLTTTAYNRRAAEDE